MKHLLFLGVLIFSIHLVAKEYTGADGVKVEINRPAKVLVLNSSNVEVIYELGKQNLIAGVDRSAEFPPEVKKLPDVGHPYRASVEGIISLKPDLVLAAEENISPESASQLRTAKIPVLVLEDTGKNGVEGLKRRIKTISEITDATAKGDALIQRLEKSFAAIKAQTDKQKNTKPLSIFFLYAHGPGEAFITGRETGSHTLIELIGAKNAADFTTGRKPLTAEAMVQAAPDVIIMLKRGMDTVGGVEGALKLPGVALTPAGKNKKIIQVDNSIRWVGPRFPQFSQELIDAIKK